LANIEADSDPHLDLQDATGDKPRIIVCEAPAAGRSLWTLRQLAKPHSYRNRHH